jgi:hypothetical protein
MKFVPQKLCHTVITPPMLHTYIRPHLVILMDNDNGLELYGKKRALFFLVVERWIGTTFTFYALKG